MEDEKMLEEWKLWDEKMLEEGAVGWWVGLIYWVRRDE